MIRFEENANGPHRLYFDTNTDYQQIRDVLNENSFKTECLINGIVDIYIDDARAHFLAHDFDSFDATDKKYVDFDNEYKNIFIMIKNRLGNTSIKVNL